MESSRGFHYVIGLRESLKRAQARLLGKVQPRGSKRSQHFENAKNNSSSGVEFSRSLEDDRVSCRRWRSDLSPLELLSQW